MYVSIQVYHTELAFEFKGKTSQYTDSERCVGCKAQARFMLSKEDKL